MGILVYTMGILVYTHWWYWYIPIWVYWYIQWVYWYIPNGYIGMYTGGYIVHTVLLLDSGMVCRKRGLRQR
jgi:hypothetical protein